MISGIDSKQLNRQILVVRQQLMDVRNYAVIGDRDSAAASARRAEEAAHLLAMMFTSSLKEMLDGDNDSGRDTPGRAGRGTAGRRAAARRPNG